MIYIGDYVDHTVEEAVHLVICVALIFETSLSAIIVL